MRAHTENCTIPCFTDTNIGAELIELSFLYEKKILSIRCTAQSQFDDACVEINISDILLKNPIASGFC